MFAVRRSKVRRRQTLLVCGARLRPPVQQLLRVCQQASGAGDEEQAIALLLLLGLCSISAESACGAALTRIRARVIISTGLPSPRRPSRPLPMLTIMWGHYTPKDPLRSGGGSRDTFARVALCFKPQVPRNLM